VVCRLRTLSRAVGSALLACPCWAVAPADGSGRPTRPTLDRVRGKGLRCPNLARCVRRPRQPWRPVIGEHLVAGVMWPTIEGRATPCRRPQSKQVPPWRPRSSVAESDPLRTRGQKRWRQTLMATLQRLSVTAAPKLAPAEIGGINDAFNGSFNGGAGDD